MKTETNSASVLDNFTKENYIAVFKSLETASTYVGKIPLPGPSTLKFFQRVVHTVSARAADELTVVKSKTLMAAFNDYKNKKEDWYETHFQPKHEPVHRHESVTVNLDTDHITEEIVEKVEHSLQRLGQSLSVVLKGMQRDFIIELETKHNAQRRTLDEKFESLEKSLINNFKAVVADQIEVAVLTNLDHISHAIVQSVAAKLPDFVKSKVDELVDIRLAEMFGSKEEPDETPAIDEDRLAAAVESSNYFRMKPKKDEPLGSNNRPLKMLILDLNRDQLSRAKNGINEKYATFDVIDSKSLTENIVEKYDYIIGTHYTLKNVGKTAAQQWPDKYVLADGNFPAVRSTVQRLINEYRKERVV